MTTVNSKSSGSIKIACWNLLASEYTKWNYPGKQVEPMAVRNRRWAQTVRIIKMCNVDVVCAQEVTREFLEYAFAGLASTIVVTDKPKENVDVNKNNENLFVEMNDVVDENIKTWVGALASEFHFVWVQRTYPSGFTDNDGKACKPDGNAIFFRKSRFAPPILDKSRALEIATTLTSVNLQEKKVQSLVTCAKESVFVPIHFTKDATAGPGDPRNAVSIRLYDLAADKPIATITSVHLEGNPDKAAIRAKQLAEAVIGQASLGESPMTYLAGDFNERKIDDVNQALIKAGMRLVELDVDSKMKAKNVNVDVKNDQVRPEDKFTCLHGAIDFVFVSQKTVATKVQIVPAIRDRIRKSLSESLKSTVTDGAPDTIYKDVPYHDARWPSDHYILINEIMFG